MTKKKFGCLIAGLGFVMLTASFSSCSTFMVANVSAPTVSYDVLGYIGSAFANYDEALTAAKKSSICRCGSFISRKNVR